MLVVEDGTGLDNANSYATVAEATAYITTFIPTSLASWNDANTAQREAILITGAKYHDSMLRWQSTLLVPTQALEFPRVPFTDLTGRTITGVPDITKDAQIRLAVESMIRPLYEPEAKLVIDMYGKSSQTYTKDGKLEGSGVIQDVRRILVNRGFGRSSTTIIEFERA